MTRAAPAPPITGSVGGILTAGSALLAVYAASGSPIPLYQRYREAGAVTSAELASTAVAYFAAAVLALLVFARVSDHLGRRPVGLVALVVAAVGSLLLLQVDSLAPVLLARVCEGFACGLASSALAAFALDSAPARLGWLASAVSAAGPMVGLTVGALLSGAAVDVTGTLWGSPVVILVLLAGSAVALLLARETVARTSGLAASLRPRVVIAPSARRLLPVVACVSVATWALGGFYQAFSPVLAAEDLGSSDPLVAGVVFSSYMAAGIIGGPLAGRFTPAAAQRIGMSGFVVGLVGILAGLSTHSIALFLIASVLAGVSQTIAFAGGLQGLLSHTDAGARAGTVAAVYLISYTGAAIPSLIVGRLGGAFTPAQIAVGYAALAVLAWIVTVIAARNASPSPHDRPSAAASRGPEPLMERTTHD